MAGLKGIVGRVKPVPVRTELIIVDDGAKAPE
jgi:hypothetical protein